jgi:hypothetical protein
MAGSGVRLFLSGEIAYAADVNSYLMDQVISRFADAAARDLAFGDGIPVSQGGDGKPELSEGRFCYLDDINEVQYYNGTSWQSASQFTVADGSITEAKLANNSVTSDKIAPGTIVASDVADNTVTEAKLTTSVAGNGLAGGNGSALSVNVDNSTIEINSDSLRVKDSGITSAKIAAAVAGNGLAGGAGSALSVNVDDSTIEINSDSLRVKDSGITSAKLSTAVAGNGLAGGGGSALSVNVDSSTIEIDSDTLRIKDLGVTTAKINAGAVTSAKLDSSISVTSNVGVGNNLSVTGTSYFAEIIEKVHFQGAASGTENIDVLTSGIHFFETSSSASCSLNFTGDGTANSFNAMTSVGQSVTGVVLITSGSTTCRPTSIAVDGVTQTGVKWFGGVSFPDGSGGGAVDSYTVTIIKTAATPTYIVLASQSKFA